MSNTVFPTLPGLGWSVVKRPIWRTLTQSMVSGKELRASMMSYPLWQFDLTYEVLRAATAYQELQTLMGFFNERNGSFDSFLYADPNDESVTAESFGTGDGATKSFQLVRAYGGFSEPILNLNGSPSLYVSGTLQTLTTYYSVSPTGVVTFVTAPAPGAVLTWTGSFYYRVRFLQDQADFEQFMYQLWSLKKLSFQSVKS